MTEVGKDQVDDFTKLLDSGMRFTKAELVWNEKIVFINERKDVVEEEAFIDLAEGVERGDGTVAREICFRFVRLQDWNAFATFPRKGKMYEFEDGVKYVCEDIKGARDLRA